MLRPSVHILPGIGWCGAGLPPFPTACWWLTHPAATTGVSVSARWNSPGGCGGPSVPLTASLAEWLRRPPQERKVPGSNPACAGIFSGSSHTSDLKIGTPVATLPGAWRYRVSAGTGRPGVSIL